MKEDRVEALVQGLVQDTLNHLALRVATMEASMIRQKKLVDSMITTLKHIINRDYLG